MCRSKLGDALGDLVAEELQVQQDLAAQLQGLDLCLGGGVRCQTFGKRRGGLVGIDLAIMSIL